MAALKFLGKPAQHKVSLVCSPANHPITCWPSANILVMSLLFFTPDFQHEGQVFDGGIALMTLDDAAKGLPGHKVNDLREQGFCLRSFAILVISQSARNNTSPSISTGMPNGSSAIPTALLAWAPTCGPNNSRIRSVKPLMTAG